MYAGIVELSFELLIEFEYPSANPCTPLAINFNLTFLASFNLLFKYDFSNPNFSALFVNFLDNFPDPFFAHFSIAIFKSPSNFLNIVLTVDFLTPASSICFSDCENIKNGTNNIMIRFFFITK